jgi:hypothetical protein
MDSNNCDFEKKLSRFIDLHNNGEKSEEMNLLGKELKIITDNMLFFKDSNPNAPIIKPFK